MVATGGVGGVGLVDDTGQRLGAGQGHTGKMDAVACPYRPALLAPSDRGRLDYHYFYTWRERGGAIGAPLPTFVADS